MSNLDGAEHQMMDEGRDNAEGEIGINVSAAAVSDLN